MQRVLLHMLWALLRRLPARQALLLVRLWLQCLPAGT
jgi:hypothetical protein